MKVLGGIWRWIFSILMPIAILGLIAVVISFKGALQVSYAADITGTHVDADGAFDFFFQGLLISGTNGKLGADIAMDLALDPITMQPIIESKSLNSVIQLGDYAINVWFAAAAGLFIVGSMLSLVGHHSILANLLGLGMVGAGLALYLMNGAGKAQIGIDFVIKVQDKPDNNISFHLPEVINALILGIAAIVLDVCNTIVCFIANSKRKAAKAA